MEEFITLAHGAGGKTDLSSSVRFKSILTIPYLTADDAAVLPAPAGKNGVITDGFIVSPY